MFSVRGRCSTTVPEVPQSAHAEPKSITAVPNRRVSPQCLEVCIAQPQSLIHDWLTAEFLPNPTRKSPCMQRLTAEHPAAPKLGVSRFAQPEIFQRFPAVHQSLTAVPNFVLSRECVTPERDHQKSPLPTSHPSTPTLGLGLELHLLCLQLITRLLEVVDDASQTQEGKGGDVRGR